MRGVLFSIALSVFTIAPSFAQTAQDYFKTGVEKQNKKEFKAAAKAYSKAIEMIPKYKDAFFNKATCEFMVSDFEGAMADFTTYIGMDSTSAKGYFGRAKVYIAMNQHQEAMPDLNRAVKLDYRLPDLLCTRGQVRGEAGNKKGACADFAKAKQLGDPNVQQFIDQICEQGNEE